jgi:mannose/fructose/N-acetylgalactosamine-specific phosphotransferase system component IIC
MSDAQLLITLALLGGALSLDVTAALQVMLSQPVAAGCIVGLAAGDPGLGLLIGAVLQLVWIGVLPVGAAPFPDGAVSSAVGVGAAVILERAGVAPGLSLPVGLIAGLMAGAASQLLTARVRQWNVRLAAAASARAELGDARGVTRAVVSALALRFATSAALVAVFVAASFALRSLSVVNFGGSFPVLLWAAPLAAGAVIVGGRARWEGIFLAGGFVAGLVLVGLL